MADEVTLVIDQFVPHRSQDEQARIRHLENYLANLAITSAATFSGGGGGIALPIPEEDIDFNPDSGHNHDGENSTPVPMSPDVTGTNIDNTVVAAQHIPLPIPIPADDGKVLTYVDATTEYQLRSAIPVTLTVTTNYLVVTNNSVILVNASAGNVTVTLPDAVGNKDFFIIIKKIDTSAFIVTVLPINSETIDLQVDYTLDSPMASLSIISDNANWWGI